MKSMLRPALVAILVVSAFVFGLITRGWLGGSTVDSTVNAQSHGQESVQSKKACTNASLRGSFGIKFDGASVTRGGVASATLVTFDGAGNFTGSDVTSLNGTIVRRTLTGTYTVNPDCTGSLKFLSDLTMNEADGDFVIVDGGKQLLIVESDSGWVATGVATKQ